MVILFCCNDPLPEFDIMFAFNTSITSGKSDNTTLPTREPNILAQKIPHRPIPAPIPVRIVNVGHI